MASIPDENREVSILYILHRNKKWLNVRYNNLLTLGCKLRAACKLKLVIVDNSCASTGDKITRSIIFPVFFYIFILLNYYLSHMHLKHCFLVLCRLISIKIHTRNFIHLFVLLCYLGNYALWSVDCFKIMKTCVSQYSFDLTFYSITRNKDS